MLKGQQIGGVSYINEHHKKKSTIFHVYYYEFKREKNYILSLKRL